MKIENRTFVVSGGSSGLGLATVLNLHEQGAFVAVVDVQEVPSDVSNKLGTKLRFWQTDLTVTEEVARAVEGAAAWARETHAPLGGVINCAGIGAAAKTVEHDGTPHSLDVWNFVIALNLTGTFDLTRRVVSELVKQDPVGPDGERGVVVMVASSAAFEGQPGQAAYAASKGAVRSMTLPMARDLGRYGIRVVTLAPSLFVSPMTERMPERVKTSLIRDVVFPRRFGETHEFAQMVRFILENTYVNGETFRLSAGGRMPGKL